MQLLCPGHRRKLISPHRARVRRFIIAAASTTLVRRFCIMRVASLFLLLMFVLGSTAFSAAPQGDLESRRKALNDLLAERWEYTLRTSPISASFLGDKRWNDKLDDFSQKAIDDDLEQSKKYLARFEAIDTTGFPEQEVLNQTLMVRDLRMSLEGARFKSWEMPVSQVG